MQLLPVHDCRLQTAVRISVLLLSFLLNGTPVAATLADETEIKQLIQQLGSTTFVERETAMKALETIGEPALKALQAAAATSNDDEIRQRAAALVTRIRGRLCPEVRRFDGHKGQVYCATFSPDGRRALTAGADRTLRLWDVQTGGEVRRFDGHTGIVLTIAFSGDGRRAVSGGADRTVRLWDIASGQELQCFRENMHQVSRVFFCGERVVSTGLDHSVHIWEADTGKEVNCWKGWSNFKLADVSGDGRRLLTGEYKTVWLHDMETGKVLRRTTLDDGAVDQVAFTADGQRGLILKNPFYMAPVSPAVGIWDLGKDGGIHWFAVPTPGTCLAVSPDGRRLLSGDGDEPSMRRRPGAPLDPSSVRVWDLGSGQELGCFSGHAGRILSVAFSPDGRQALSTSEDKTVRLWSLPK